MIADLCEGVLAYVVIFRIEDARYIFGEEKGGSCFSDKPEKMSEEIVAGIVNLAFTHGAETLARWPPDQSVQLS